MNKGLAYARSKQQVVLNIYDLKCRCFDPKISSSSHRKEVGNSKHWNG